MAPAARFLPPALLRQHAGHQPGLPARLGPAGFPDPRGAGGDAVAAYGASTAASSCARPRRCPAARNISIPKNTNRGRGTGTRRATSSPRSPRSTRSAGATRRCRRISGLEFLSSGQRPDAVLREGRRRTAPTWCWRREPRSRAPAGGQRRRAAVGVGPRRTVARSRSTDLLTGGAGRGRPGPAHRARSRGSPSRIWRAAGANTTSAKKPRTTLPDDPLWYKDAVIYQLHVKSFYEANNDGIGDFRA